MSAEISRGGFHAGSGRMRTTTSYSVASRSSGITRRARRVVTLPLEQQPEMGSCSESLIPLAEEKFMLWI